MTTDMYRQTGEVKTDMYCHECGKNFVALVDFSLDGNHAIECPHCGHEHQRVIRNGLVTDQRFGSTNGNKLDPHRPRRTWKHQTLPALTTTASAFIRERWLDRIR